MRVMGTVEEEGPVRLAARGPFTPVNALLYLRRALAQRCPVCGESRLFAPASSVRSLHAWLTPLEGCPLCRYRYERESGYFLLATWVVNYVFVGGLALLAWFLIANFTRLSLVATLLILLIPMPFASLILARHAKALWLALDHFVDPHRRRGLADRRR
jgi:uncharacterized protein (DUF983 family)